MQNPKDFQSRRIYTPGMWTCQACSADVEDDSWTNCWQCSSPRSRSAEESAEVQAELQRVARFRAEFRTCLRCEAPLKHVGTKHFHEGAGRPSFWFGDFGELFVGREAFDLYCCPRCGKVEFYIDGIGDSLRGETED